ncbi:MAG: hypothetical protein J3K34DRAFT_516949 [Monoraphidium minutum]|nr:MAG: hypothetical protein J3K34DRAFT_516949 [Monoraphidium minutum]
MMAQRGMDAGAAGVSQQRQPWSQEEDGYLVSAVEKYGTQRWSQISRSLKGRTSKACSHRWRTYLQPGVKHTTQEPFSDWEVAVVVEAHRVVGNQWSTIARMLPGRTNAAVKNFWYAHTRRGARGAAAGGGGGGGGGASEGGPADSGAAGGGGGGEYGCGGPAGDYGGAWGSEAVGSGFDEGCFDDDEDGEFGGGEEGGAGCGSGGDAATATAGGSFGYSGGQLVLGEEGAAAGLGDPMDAEVCAGAGQAVSGAPSVGRPPLRIKLGRSGGGAGMALPPRSTMPPPRASAAGGGGSPVLRRSDAGCGHGAGCDGLQLQGSSQPLQQEQLGLLPLPHAPGAPWMRVSSGGREPRPGVSRLGSSGVAAAAAAAAGGSLGPEAFMPSGFLGGGGAAPLPPPLMLGAGGSAAFGCAADRAAATAAAAAAALACAPGVCLPEPGGSGRLLSVPSHGLSGLLWETGGGAEGGAAGGGGGLGGGASQELLLEAFRDMREPQGPPAPSGPQRSQQPSAQAAAGAPDLREAGAAAEEVTAAGGAKRGRDAAGLPGMLGNPGLLAAVTAAAAAAAAGNAAASMAAAGGLEGDEEGAAGQAKRAKA